MTPTPKYFSACLMLLFIGSLTFKTLSFQTGTAAGLHSTAQPQLAGLTHVKSVQPVNRGAFEIAFYQSPQCDGTLALMALSKNEEGAGILAYYLKRPVTDIEFIYQGKRHQNFPAFAYWLGSLNPFSAPTSVYAVAEFGVCDFIQRTDWSQI